MSIAKKNIFAYYISTHSNLADNVSYFCERKEKWQILNLQKKEY